MSRDEFKESLKLSLDDFTALWTYIRDGKKFSEEFGPGKIICLLLQDLGKDPKLIEQAKDVFNEANFMYVSIASQRPPVIVSDYSVQHSLY